MNNLRIFTFLVLLLPWVANAQMDSIHYLTLDELYRHVRQNHPIAQQAILMNQRGSLTVSQARGAFDPKIVSGFDRKTFDGTNYYDLWDTYVKIPTLLNIDLKAGYERNQGTYLNPEHKVPADGLYYAGISVPLGQGLIHNERNINLQKSKFTQKAFENDANNVLNNLFLDVNYAYWYWFESHQKREAVRSNLSLIQERFEGIKQGTINGENAPIDSVEMLIQVQQWINNLRQAELDLQNSRLLLNNFIWSDSMDLSSFSPLIEDETQNLALDSYLDWAIINHPDLKQLSIESNILDLDRKLSSEQLKPIIDVNYNLLLTDQSELESSFYANNYKFGVQFAFPLLIRKERSKLKIIKIKQQEYDLKINQKTREVINKIQQGYNKVYTLEEMIEQQKDIQVNYEKMLQAEQVMFENGESSVFLLNSRENKKLLGQIKLIELQSKYQQSLGELKWSTGKLYDEINALNP
ncbi:TolC family protein [Reichenbachiella agarivorans]|uniref:TolC family protein n=1 Tax=Reichenbachiella agarivorans TaxID=2979464 RepID=A0ABY6CQF3_9BACT|nr:TolC family protein [Reichenbachiella agarivorans]UXP32748.1 TolC family protein [Reichenbachiella agarivorans]